LLVDYHSAIPDVLLQHISTAGRPAVWLNADLPTDTVRPDDFSAGRDLALALAAAGHRHVAWLDESYHHPVALQHYSKIARREGFSSACRSARLRLKEIDDSPGSTPLLQRLRELIASPDRPSAIVAYGMEYREVIDACARAGLELGRDLVSCCFASEGTTFYGAFPIQAVVLPEKACGALAVTRLLERMSGTRAAGWATETVPCTIPGHDSLSFNP
jgi:LacI family transcriptional regulator